MRDNLSSNLKLTFTCLSEYAVQSKEEDNGWVAPLLSKEWKRRVKQRTQGKEEVIKNIKNQEEQSYRRRARLDRMEIWSPRHYAWPLWKRSRETAVVSGCFLRLKTSEMLRWIVCVCVDCSWTICLDQKRSITAWEGALGPSDGGLIQNPCQDLRLCLLAWISSLPRIIFISKFKTPSN